MGMLVTVVTLYDDSMVETFVAVVHGTVDANGREELGNRFNAAVQDGKLDEQEDQRVLRFVEVQTCDSHLDVSDMPNIDGSRA